MNRVPRNYVFNTAGAKIRFNRLNYITYIEDLKAASEAVEKKA